jgi:prolipoprotein diacylglyceryltransferase
VASAHTARRSSVDPAPLRPALPSWQVPLGAVLVALSVATALIAWRAHRAGAMTTARSLLLAALPGALWLLVANLGPTHPTRLQVSPFGLLLVSAFVCGLVAAHSAGERADVSSERAYGLYLWSSVAGVLGARALYVLAHLGELPGWRSAAQLHAGGLSINGALLGGVMASWIGFAGQPQRWRAWLDGIAPALGLCLGLASLGAFLHAPTSPAELYQSLVGFILAGSALYLSARQRFHGQCFVLVALGYGIVQLSLDAASGSAGHARAGGAILLSSWLVVALALVAGWAWHKGLTFRRI